ncbi:CD63 antigen [Acromyrmex echinatior]|uniref:CD63 antigen n=1 Tax=Acromyrmex echinatior TaxID=103372 RepID=F4WCE2_ACREC|nr:CD63 antigen [Acromyrmex echinatior]
MKRLTVNVFYVLFQITGIVFISVGGVILVVYSGYSNFVDSWFFAAPLLMIVVGVIVFLVSFFGCCGAVKENHCMIITFSVLLLLIFALELGAGITGYMMRGEVANMLENRLNDTLRQYELNPDIRRSWDIMQHDPIQSRCDLNSIHVYSEGCMMKLQSAIENNAMILGGVGIGVALIQLIGVVFACCLARSIRREYETV